MPFLLSSHADFVVDFILLFCASSMKDFIFMFWKVHLQHACWAVQMNIRICNNEKRGATNMTTAQTLSHWGSLSKLCAHSAILLRFILASFVILVFCWMETRRYYNVIHTLTLKLYKSTITLFVCFYFSSIS